MIILYIVIPAAVAVLYRLFRSRRAAVDAEELAIALDCASSEAVHL